jgi:hypothetical protein
MIALGGPVLLALSGCWAPEEPPVERPEGVPVAAAFLRYSGNDLKLDDTVIGPWKALTEDRDVPYEPLVTALDESLTKESGTWIALPDNATWGEARRAISAVFDADADPIWLGALGDARAVGPLDNAPGGRAMPACPDGPVPVVGVGSRLTIELHADTEQSWANATVRFKPLVRLPGEAPVITELLPRECWQPPTCAVLGTPEAVAACEAGFGSTEPVTDRVAVAGKGGCILPFADGHRHGDWPKALASSLDRLAIGPETSAMVIADETVEYGGVLAVVAGLSEHGITAPQVGLLRMGSGDRAPLCEVEIRDADALTAAAARWFGYQLASGDPGAPR